MDDECAIIPDPCVQVFLPRRWSLGPAGAGVITVFMGRAMGLRRTGLRRTLGVPLRIPRLLSRLCSSRRNARCGRRQKVIPPRDWRADINCLDTRANLLANKNVAQNLGNSSSLRFLRIFGVFVSQTLSLRDRTSRSSPQKISIRRRHGVSRLSNDSPTAVTGLVHAGGPR